MLPPPSLSISRILPLLYSLVLEAIAKANMVKKSPATCQCLEACPRIAEAKVFFCFFLSKMFRSSVLMERHADVLSDPRGFKCQSLTSAESREIFFLLVKISFCYCCKECAGLGPSPSSLRVPHYFRF